MDPFCYPQKQPCKQNGDRHHKEHQKETCYLQRPLFIGKHLSQRLFRPGDQRADPLHRMPEAVGISQNKIKYKSDAKCRQ